MISSAVKVSNPEVVRARELAIPVIPRAEMLAELMRLKDGVAVGGSHGKTTTTSLIAHVLRSAGRDVQMGKGLGHCQVTARRPITAMNSGNGRLMGSPSAP